MNSKKVNKRKSLIILLFCIICLLLFLSWQNNSIVITKSEYSNPELPKEFDGFVIAQISDLHNKEFGKEQKILLRKLKSTAPDIILVTGDLIDRRRYDLEKDMNFIKGALKIAPVYYVSGNHEAWSDQYTNVKASLINSGVTVLDNSMVEYTIGNSSINLLGLQDPAFISANTIEDTKGLGFYDSLKQWSSNDNFQILLSHRPELFDLYTEHNIDLVFSGHAHGGQFRLPFIGGGLVAPDQGVFPQYTSGSYNKNQTTMYVSRGLGNSIIPIRIFNRPEIVLVKLKSQAIISQLF